MFDGIQTFNAGILRAIGAQLFSSVFMFVGFGVVGMPLSIALFLLTPLKIYGMNNYYAIFISKFLSSLRI